jgi:hypothetical protein
MNRKTPLKRQIEAQISRCWKRRVFTRKDFIPMGDYDQVGRALLTLTREGKLIRIGYGLYAKARINRITGLPMLASDGGFEQVAKEALDLLNVEWRPGSTEQDYNNGSTQIPINAQVFINSRFSRKIRTDKFSLQVQRN